MHHFIHASQQVIRGPGMWTSTTNFHSTNSNIEQLVDRKAVETHRFADIYLIWSEDEGLPIENAVIKVWNQMTRKNKWFNYLLPNLLERACISYKWLIVANLNTQFILI